MILARYQTEGPFDDAAKFLVCYMLETVLKSLTIIPPRPQVQTALEKGSADNITAVVVFL